MAINGNRSCVTLEMSYSLACCRIPEDCGEAGCWKWQHSDSDGLHECGPKWDWSGGAEWTYLRSRRPRRDLISQQVSTYRHFT